MPELLLEVKDLCRRSPVPGDDREILSGITFELLAGEAVAVLGTSGAGKTALLRCIAGLDAIDSGEVLVRGRSLGDRDPRIHRQEVALVPERPVLLGETLRHSIDRCLGFAATRKRRPPRLDPVPLLNRVRLGAEILDRKGLPIIGSELFRVALVRALLLGPSVLLIDEPASALDPEALAAVEALLLDLKRQGLGLVIVTREDRRAKRLAERALILWNGVMHVFAASEEAFPGTA
jgi:ABC-type iron transport system FetAB ATPase subunit